MGQEGTERGSWGHFPGTGLLEPPAAARPCPPPPACIIPPPTSQPGSHGAAPPSRRGPLPLIPEGPGRSWQRPRGSRTPNTRKRGRKMFCFTNLVYPSLKKKLDSTHLNNTLSINAIYWFKKKKKKKRSRKVVCSPRPSLTHSPGMRIASTTELTGRFSTLRNGFLYSHPGITVGVF